MDKAKLTISGPAGTRQAPLNPKGITLGRSANCDVMLDNNNVSRHHARIYQDPFGRWIVEDLGSSNGVLIDGQLIKAQAVLPGQKVDIADFTLSILLETDQQTIPVTSVRDTVPIIDRGMEEDIVSRKAEAATVLSPALMQHLNGFTAQILKLSSPAELYSQSCQSLAGILNTLVAIIRLPKKPEQLPKSPDILTCNFGRNVRDVSVLQTYNLNLSKRVLDTVRSSENPVKASSGLSSEQRMKLTVVDEHEPHVVFSVQVNDSGDAVDVLYVDILESKAPSEMFDFMQAVGQQINFVQKNLFFTELKKQEKALREANTQLREKDRIKDEYVSRVTHDIKGHITAIQSCNYIAGDKSSGTLNEKQANYLSRARNRTKQLSDYVNELLNLTQMRLSGQFKTAPFNLPSTISRALTTVERKAKDKSITVTSNVEPALDMLVGNQFSIEEVITNLLFNAIKYTPENKTVHLDAKKNGEYIQIDIIDTGIGIPEDEVENVFEEFFRARNAKETEKDGTGLGLSIVKQIVDRHKGKISVESREGQGSKFTVAFPEKGPS